MELKAGSNDAGRRLDRILRKALPDHPLSLIHRLLRQGRVLVNGRPSGAEDRVNEGALITIPVNAAARPTGGDTPLESALPPAALPELEILKEGGGLLILNKPGGLAVHGPGSLESRVCAYLTGKLPSSLSFRPGPLHRLDKPTSGVIVFSSSLEGARRFSALLRDRQVKKYYLALAEGRLEKDEVWEDALVRDHDAKKTFLEGGGVLRGEKAKSAFTTVKALSCTGGKSGPEYTLLLAEIKTGRTHQIRAQAASHGFPLAGDIKYGGHSFNGDGAGGGFFLHAWQLVLGEMTVTAPLPEAFRKRLASLFGEKFRLTRAGFNP